MDREYLIDFLDEFITATNDFDHWNGRDLELVSQVQQRLQEMVPALRLVGERHAPREVEEARELLSNREQASWSVYRSVALAARGSILRCDAILAALGPATDTPQLDTATMHPAVWQAAEPYWSTRFYRDAVHAAADVLDARIRRKAGREDLHGTALVTQVLNTELARAGQPRLRVRADDRSLSANSLREGVFFFARGCYLALRNPAAHDQDELSPEVALEQLAAFSLLARWIDESTVASGFQDPAAIAHSGEISSPSAPNE